MRKKNTLLHNERSKFKSIQIEDGKLKANSKKQAK